MMRANIKGLLFILTLALLNLGGQEASAKLKFGGVIGFDWQNFGFQREPNNLKDSLNFGRTDRTLLNHYLELSLSGNIAESNFADYRLFGGFWGRFNQTSTDEYDNKSDYQFLNLSTYAGQFVFFPKRRYPLKLFHIKTEDLSLEYEQGYRGSTNLLETGLATIRKYESAKLSTGAEFKYNFSDDFVFTTRVATQEDQRLRIYEFEENRDIWVQLTIDYTTPVTTNVEVFFENGLDDDSIRIILSTYELLLRPGDTTTLSIDTGTYTVDIVPFKYKELTLQAIIDRNMIWRVEFTKPPGSSDTDLERDNIFSQLKYEGESKLANTAVLDISDEFNFVTDAQTKKTNLTNLTTYRYSQETDMQMKATYFSNESIVSDIPSQDLSKYELNTIFNRTPRKGLQSYFSHLYATTTSVTRGEEVSNDVNDFESRLNYDFKKMRSRFGLKTNLTMQSNSKEEKNRELKNTLFNQFEYVKLGIKWIPYFEFINTKEKAESISSKDIYDTNGDFLYTDNTDLALNTTRNEFRIRLTNEVLNTKKYGMISMTSEFYTQKQKDDFSTSSRKTYKTEMMAIKSISDKMVFSFNSLLELQTADEGVEDEKRSSLRFDLQNRFSDNHALGGNIMFLSDPKTSEVRYNVSLFTLIPYFKLPFLSSLVYQDRTIFSTTANNEGVLIEKELPQSNLTWENSFKTKIRKITIEFEHKYSNEKLTNNNFIFHEISAKVKRVF